MASVITTDRHRSVRNRYIESFGGVFVLSLCVLGFSVGVRAFVIPGRAESDLFLILLTDEQEKVHLSASSI